MEPAVLIERIREIVGAAVVTASSDGIDPTVELASGDSFGALQTLRDHPELAFDTLSNLCGVDYFEPDHKRAAKFPHEPHIEIVYHLHSLRLGHRLTAKLRLPRWQDDVAGQRPRIASVSSLWDAANWHERECYDLLGIEFTGHPNLTRILCPEDWVGHALRKDYEMPLEYRGIRGR